MRACLSILILFILSLSSLHAQQGVVSGKVTDATTKEVLPGVTILLTLQADSTKKTGTVSDEEGNFIIEKVNFGIYTARFSYLGYSSKFVKVVVDKELIPLGTILLGEDVKALEEFVKQGRAIRVQQKGDTTQYNADAYKTNPDANAEDLIKKMPGVTTDNNGKVQAQGEEVKKVLIDGKEFFGDDATMALKNIPAEIIDKIQVFDKQSDQAQFTGVSDGNETKTINIITKSGKSNGQFGKVYAGYGTDGRYIAGGNINYFKGDRRISLIGLSNNVNQQNFASEDLLGVLGSNNSRRGGGGNRGRGGPGQSSADNFLTGQQGGITGTHALGINYMDKWGKKFNITGSYFFNYSSNENNSSMARTFFARGEAQQQFYTETNNSESNNGNHRFNFRLEYLIDSSNTILMTPRLSLQNNSFSSVLNGLNTLSGITLLSKTASDYYSENNGYTFNNNILYRHKFAKTGRTFSSDLGFSLNDKSGNTHLLSANEYYDTTSTLVVLDQQSNTSSDGSSLTGNFAYTEPISKKSILMFNYSPSFSSNQSNKETYALDNVSNTYATLDTLLSSKFNNTVTTHRSGLSFRRDDSTYNLMVGVNYQFTTLEGAQSFPYNFQVNTDFSNVLPMIRYRYNISKQKSVRVNYRTNTNIPSISQLQSVVDNSNTLLLKTGNSDLKQEYSHNLSTNYRFTEAATARSFFAFVNVSRTMNYIGNSTLIASRDTVLSNGVTLLQGSQLSKPVNLDGYWNARAFLTYGMPVDKIKSNLNLNAGFTYQRSPGLINDRLNLVNTYNMNGGLVLSSNISESFDFTISTSANYNIVRNSLQSTSNNNYYFQLSNVRFNYLTKKNYFFNTELYHTLYTGLGQAYNQNYLLWNASAGKKFLKNNRGELKITVFDILHQNNSISRNVSETYVEDIRTQVLNTYVMLVFTYQIKNFRL